MKSNVKIKSSSDRPSYFDLAKKGDSNAQFELARMYATGSGGPQDYIKARHWFLQSAKQGNSKAQTNLGILLARGQGGDKDYIGARKWFLKASEQNDGEAYFNLAALYNGGWGVKKNHIKAIEYAKLSCINNFQLGCEIHQKLINSK
uniref:Polar organelle development protein n=1 Tax=Pectobacterium carotovorum TaxID=554 RepID=A0A0K0MNF7_PECCA|nr:Polar organelle development protein [Pectobacterium carotovorum]